MNSKNDLKNDENLNPIDVNQFLNDILQLVNQYLISKDEFTALVNLFLNLYK